MKIVNFIKVAGNCFNSDEDYVKSQRFQASWIISELNKKIDLTDKVILDLGGGIGGYSIELSMVVKKCMH